MSVALASPPVTTTARATADRITDLAVLLEQRLDSAISSITDLNDETKMLSLNARMEAARAGGHAGAAFGVVAIAIRTVSDQMVRVAQKLAEEARVSCTELRQVNNELATRVKGERLSDLALMNIDVIDRNLYERSCDCRWWATDASVVGLLTDPTPDQKRFCSERLGQILDSYTVYFDIVVADLNGNVVANGRPKLHPSTGKNYGNAPWFTQALATRDGTEFGFQSVHTTPLANGERVLVYSCTVRENGHVHGRPLGVLAVVFRWDALGQTIVQKTPLSDAERSLTRVCIIEPDGTLLADSEQRFLSRLDLTEFRELLLGDKNHRTIDQRSERVFVGHAAAPGFETYTTGWHSLIIQRVPQSSRHK